MKTDRKLIDAIITFVILAVIITIGNIVLGIRIEILLILSCVYPMIASRKYGLKWVDLEDAISNRLKSASNSIYIIWSIGAVIASFMFSGSIPYLIKTGMTLINPKLLYLCTFLLCTVLSVATGTSWGSATTGGIPMVGIAAGLGLSVPITAAAAICGATVGDKISPLSETTNMSSLCCKVNIYRHVYSMLYTTTPTAIISCVFFFVLGRSINASNNGIPALALEMIDTLDKIFSFSPLMLIPFLIILGGAALKKSAPLTMLGASFSAVVIGALCHGFDIAVGFECMVTGFTVSKISDISVGDTLAMLLNRGGMRSMVSVVLIVFFGYAFAGIIEKAGFMEVIVEKMVGQVKTRFGLMVCTMGVNILLAIASGASYTGFILCGEFFRKRFIELGMEPCVLSRTLEDSGTMITALIPWSMTGAFYVATFGVSVYGKDGYAMWAINNWLNPVAALVLVLIGFGMFNLTREQQKALLEM